MAGGAAPIDPAMRAADSMRGKATPKIPRRPRRSRRPDAPTQYRRCHDPDHVPLRERLETLAAHGLDKAELWFSDATADGSTPSESLYRAMANASYNEDPMSTARWLQEMREHYELTQEDLKLLVRALGMSRNVERMTEEFEMLYKTNVRIDMATWNAVIRAHLHLGQLRLAEGIIDKMEKSGRKPNAALYHMMVWSCTAQQDMVRAEFWVDKMKAEDVDPQPVAASMLKEYTRLKDLKSVDEWVKRVESYGANADSEALQQAVSSLLTFQERRPCVIEWIISRADQLEGETAHEFYLKAMQSISRVDVGNLERLCRHYYDNGYPMKASTHNFLLEAHVWSYRNAKYTKLSAEECQRHYDAAESVFSELLSWRDDYGRKLTPTTKTYRLLISMYMEDKKLDEVIDVMEHMIKDKLEPYSMHFRFIVTEALERGKIHVAEKWFNKANDIGLGHDELTYLKIIHFYASMGKSEEVEYWASRMENEGFTLNTQAYNSLIGAWARAGEPERARWWFDRMIESDSVQSKPNIVTYTELIRMEISMKNYHLAEKWFNDMIKRGVKPDLKFSTMIILQHFSTGRYDGAEHLAHELIGTQAAPDLYLYNIMVHGFSRLAAKEGFKSSKGQEFFKKAESWCDRMLEKGVKTDYRTFTALANLPARVGNWEYVDEKYKQLIGGDNKGNQYTENLRLAAYVRAGQNDAALRKRAMHQLKLIVERKFVNKETLKLLVNAAGIKPTLKMLVTAGVPEEEVSVTKLQEILPEFVQVRPEKKQNKRKSKSKRSKSTKKSNPGLETQGRETESTAVEMEDEGSAAVRNENDGNDEQTDA